MAQTDNRAHPHLPITAEVGSEGGSYADPTNQVASLQNDVARASGHGGASSAATQATRHDMVEGGGLSAAPDPNHGMIRYPTEPPPLSSAV